MYVGALRVLQNQDSNPEFLPQSAHSLRELMEKIPLKLDVPLPKEFNLTVKIKELRLGWKGWDTFQAAAGTAREQIVITWFKKCKEFFVQFDEKFPSRKENYKKMISALDGSPVVVPDSLRDLEAEKWMRCRDFFVSVAHHGKVVPMEEFEGWIFALEKMLLDYLQPRTFNDRSAINKLIQKAEGHD